MKRWQYYAVGAIVLAGMIHVILLTLSLPFSREQFAGMFCSGLGVVVGLDVLERWTTRRSGGAATLAGLAGVFGILGLGFWLFSGSRDTLLVAVLWIVTLGGYFIRKRLDHPPPLNGT